MRESDDVLMGTLSVRENLLFSANLRLEPQFHSSADKRPTTGLDAYTANCIVALLRRNGKTVIFSIHQPRYSIFEQFDQLILMHKGEVVYAAEADKALEYFSLLGYHIKAFNNPADFFLDIINGESESTLELPAVTEVGQVCRTFEGGFQTKAEKAEYVTSFSYQMRILCHRAVLNLLRTPQTSYAQLALTIFFAMLNANGYYRTSVYFLSKIFADLIPNRILPVIAFSTISYYMMGLKPGFVDFLCFSLTMSLTSIAAVSIAFLVSATVSSQAMANILVALPFVIMMAMFITELRGQLFYIGNNTGIAGELFLEGQGIDYSPWGFWQNQVALAAIILACLTPRSHSVHFSSTRSSTPPPPSSSYSTSSYLCRSFRRDTFTMELTPPRAAASLLLVLMAALLPARWTASGVRVSVKLASSWGRVLLLTCGPLFAEEAS
ncbi:hypothetical protein CRUP_021639 [Coryphaenoides rupestris]|nr:hypothetical protein CRUP_021639 [Coryphaenoides rupestris]